MIVVAVVGTSGSGKTRTIEYLISQLSREGYKVGSIKHIHHPDFTMDTEGTDTWRHMRAGSIMTVAIAPRETVIITRTKPLPPDLDKIFKFFKEEEVDFVFIEGFHSLIAKRRDIQKIIVAKNVEDLMRTLNGTAEPILAITGAIAKEKPKVRGIKVPIVDIYDEGNELLKLLKQQANKGKLS